MRSGFLISLTFHGHGGQIPPFLDRKLIQMAKDMQEAMPRHEALAEDWEAAGFCA
jgi:hypothetical protein